MNWRPENWEEIKWTTIPYNAPAITGDELGKIFEAGAGTMLEKVCEEIEKVANPYYQPTGQAHKDCEVMRKKILALLRSEKII